MRQGIITLLCILHTYKLPLIICKDSDHTCVFGVTSMFAALLFNGFIMGFEHSVQLQLVFFFF